MPSCLSSLVFGSYLAYSPRGQSETSQRSRTLCYNIKNDSLNAISGVSERLARKIQEREPYEMLQEVLGEEVILVPCPRSTRLVSGGLWPGDRICRALVKNGLGREVLPLLKRVRAVKKSSSSAPRERPTITDHIESMAAERTLLERDAQVTLVDDVVTKGATLLAGASVLADMFPHAQIAGFALVRTLGLQPEIDRIADPCLGKITLHGTEPDRVP